MKNKVVSYILLFVLLSIISLVVLRELNKGVENREFKRIYEKQGYLEVLQNDDFLIIEKKVSTTKDGLVDVDFSTLRRNEQDGQEVEENFDCEWVRQFEDGIEVYVCTIVGEKTYELKSTTLTDFSSNYQIVIGGEVVAERQLSKLTGPAIQSVRLMGSHFVVDFQTDLDIEWVDRSDELLQEYRDEDFIPAVEEIKAYIPKGFYSSIWIDGVDVLKGTNDTEAFFPFQFGSDFGYFVKAHDGKIALIFDGEAIEFDYTDILHYGCCEDAALNILPDQDSFNFFAQKVDGWYHVECSNI
jgi:hypothetical protein